MTTVLSLLQGLPSGLLLCVASQYAYIRCFVARASVQSLSHDDAEIRLMLKNELICSCLRILYRHRLAFAVFSLPSLSAFG